MMPSARGGAWAIFADPSSQRTRGNQFKSPWYCPLANYRKRCPSTMQSDRRCQRMPGRMPADQPVGSKWNVQLHQGDKTDQHRGNDNGNWNLPECIHPAFSKKLWPSCGVGHLNVSSLASTWGWSATTLIKVLVYVDTSATNDVFRLSMAHMYQRWTSWHDGHRRCCNCTYDCGRFCRDIFMRQ